MGIWCCEDAKTTSFVLTSLNRAVGASDIVTVTELRVMNDLCLFLPVKPRELQVRGAPQHPSDGVFTALTATGMCAVIPLTLA